LTGATGALPVWTSLMRQISTQPVTLLPPDNVKIVGVDRYTGLLANNACGNARAYPYIAGSEPTLYSACGNEVVEPEKSWFEEFFPD